MKLRSLFALIIISLAATFASGQVSKTWVRQSSGAPSTCPAGTITIDTTTGNTYSLKTGTGCKLSGTVSSAVIASIQSGAYLSCTDAVGTDSYACSLSPAIAAYTTGMTVVFKAGTANTGAASLNLNSLGAKTIVKVAGGITTALADNDIRSGQIVITSYDGANFQMQSTNGNAPSYDVAMSYSGVPAASSVIRVVVPRAFNSGSSWAGSLCSANVAATAQTDFVLAVNGVTKLTLRFAALGTTCSLVSPTSVTFVAGDVITVTSPGTPDATLSDVAISLKGTLP